KRIAIGYVIVAANCEDAPPPEFCSAQGPLRGLHALLERRAFRGLKYLGCNGGNAVAIHGDNYCGAAIPLTRVSSWKRIEAWLLHPRSFGTPSLRLRRAAARV